MHLAADADLDAHPMRVFLGNCGADGQRVIDPEDESYFKHIAWPVRDRISPRKEENSQSQADHRLAGPEIILNKHRRVNGLGGVRNSRLIEICEAP